MEKNPSNLDVAIAGWTIWLCLLGLMYLSGGLGN